MAEIPETLKERNSVYGPFDVEAEMVSSIMEILFKGKIDEIAPVAYHAIQMIVVKLVRACNGDAAYTDNYHDIAGYATLAEKYFAREDKERA